MLVYCFVCYLIMGGILFRQKEYSSQLEFSDYFIGLFAPIVVPIFFGYIINNNYHD